MKEVREVSEKKESDDNMSLALACRSAGTACCKDGHIFLPKPEYEAIIQHLASRPQDLAEFMSRVNDHGDFLLYNQQTRCQFLSADEQCTLHSLGLKPTECFWWPAHIYLADDGGLEIRVANCCSGCHVVQSKSPHVQKMAEQAKTIGFGLIANFRRIHSYGKNYRVVGRL